MHQKWHKPLLILCGFAIIVLLFLLFQESIYRWSCERESNSASCFFVGKGAIESGNIDEGLRFLNKSCDLDYGLSCFEIFKYYQKSGEIQKAEGFKKKACSLDVKDLCIK